MAASLSFAFPVEAQSPIGLGSIVLKWLPLYRCTLLAVILVIRKGEALVRVGIPGGYDLVKLVRSGIFKSTVLQATMRLSGI